MEVTKMTELRKRLKSISFKNEGLQRVLRTCTGAVDIISIEEHQGGIHNTKVIFLMADGEKRVQFYDRVDIKQVIPGNFISSGDVVEDILTLNAVYGCDFNEDDLIIEGGKFKAKSESLGYYNVSAQKPTIPNVEPINYIQGFWMGWFDPLSNWDFGVYFDNPGETLKEFRLEVTVDNTKYKCIVDLTVPSNQDNESIHRQAKDWFYALLENELSDTIRLTHHSEWQQMSYTPNFKLINLTDRVLSFDMVIYCDLESDHDGVHEVWIDNVWDRYGPFYLLPNGQRTAPNAADYPVSIPLVDCFIHPVFKTTQLFNQAIGWRIVSQNTNKATRMRQTLLDWVWNEEEINLEMVIDSLAWGCGHGCLFDTAEAMGNWSGDYLIARIYAIAPDMSETEIVVIELGTDRSSYVAGQEFI